MLNDQIIPNPQQKSYWKRLWEKHVTPLDFALIAVIVFFVAVNLVLGVSDLGVRKQLRIAKETLSVQHTNNSILNFLNLFINKVLKSQGEIDFETRLNLEGAVRGLKDEQVLLAWQSFTNAKTEPEAQTAVKNLLGILVAKLQ